MLDAMDTPYRGGVLCLMRWIRHTEGGIMLDVMDTPYKGGVLCLIWWIRHTKAGYYANVVGYHA